MQSYPRFSLILLSAGAGRRFNGEKQFATINNFPLWYYSFFTFSKLKAIQEIILVINPKDKKKYQSLIAGSKKKILLANGGEERYYSVFNGLQLVGQENDFVLIHDTARPFIHLKDIHHLLKIVIAKNKAVIPGQKLTDTVKTVSDDNFIHKNLNRESLIAVSTPQIFPREKLLKSYREFFKGANASKPIPTDDCEIYSADGNKVRYYWLNYPNPKLTFKSDLDFFQKIVASHPLAKKQVNLKNLKTS